MDLKKIETIIFDLGGVIIDLDEKETQNQIEALRDVDKPLFDFQIFKDVETDALSSEDFINAIRASCTDNTTHNQIIDAWNAMLVAIPKRRLDLMKQLMNSHKVLVLSNTNHIHAQRFDEMLKEECGDSLTLDDFAHKVYYSQNMGLRKPDTAIYQAVLDESNINAETTLFLDDKQENLEAAKTLGIKTVRVETPDMIFDILGAALQ